ncbi:hypothetical protein [Mucilaginibacter terrae]|uniref:Uncharacterized protein n=1 Tax=Mucilaginibacter terrae TaxID=1955052 RepID=A0ABU3GNE7_9SPHI|nr:hypothetical protein [Mucilaginibacter terrae]MDT3401310.1 hypothetical protein [Mucilaginibacter terrae]
MIMILPIANKNKFLVGSGVVFISLSVLAFVKAGNKKEEDGYNAGVTALVLIKALPISGKMVEWDEYIGEI